MVGADRAELAYRQHAVGLVRFTTALVGPSDAPDVVSAAMLSCFTSPSWGSVVNVDAYLYRAVLNQARHHHRSSQRRERRELLAVSAAVVADRDVRDDVWEAVARLSVRQPAVTVLTYVDDLTVGEVAARLGITDGAVRRHLARARGQLRKGLHD
jgi:RNA polymerase sigma-70 factor (ECF subfamily)